MDKFYITAFIIITLLITYTIFQYLKPKVHKHKLFRIISEKLNQENSKILLSTERCYDFKLRISNDYYAIKIISIVKNAEITINNPITWELHFGGGEYLGKPYKNRRYLTEIVPFLKLKTEFQKIVIVIPDPKRILKWINESEMQFISAEQIVNGVRIMNIEDFFNFIYPYSLI